MRAVSRLDGLTGVWSQVCTGTGKYSGLDSECLKNLSGCLMFKIHELQTANMSGETGGRSRFVLELVSSVERRPQPNMDASVRRECESLMHPSGPNAKLSCGLRLGHW